MVAALLVSSREATPAMSVPGQSPCQHHNPDGTLLASPPRRPAGGLWVWATCCLCHVLSAGGPATPPWGLELPMWTCLGLKCHYFPVPHARL